MNKYLDELRKKDIAELNKMLKEMRISYADETLKFKLGKATSPEAKRKSKREIAQILTVLKEKEILNG